MRDVKIKNLSTLCGATVAIVFLLLVITLIDQHQKALAFDEEGYIEFIVSKTNGSNNNRTSTAQIPVGSKRSSYSAKGLFG